MPAANAPRTAARRSAAKAESGPIGKTLGLDPGDVVDRIVGVITKIYPPEEKQGKYGSYTIQNCEMELEYLNRDRIDEAPTVRISIFDEELPPEYMNESITMSSVKLKGAKQGVSYECARRENKCYENFKVAGKNAIWDYTNPDAAREAAPAARPEPEPASRHTQEERATPAPKESKVEYDDPSHRPVSRVTALEIVTAVADVHKMVVDRVLEQYPKIADVTIQSFISTIFIDVSKQGAVAKLLAERSPLKTAGLAAPRQMQSEHEKPIEPPNYSDWRNVIIPVGSDNIKGKKLGDIEEFLRYDLWKFLVNKKQSTGKEHTPFALFVMAAGDELNYAETKPSMPEPEDMDIPF